MLNKFEGQKYILTLINKQDGGEEADAFCEKLVGEEN